MLGQKRFGKLQTAAIVIIALVMGANLISPAVAHVTRSIKHLYKHLDQRYVNVGEKAASAASADNADNLDGLDSTELSQGGGASRSLDLALTGSDQTVVTTTVPTSGPRDLLVSAGLSLVGNGGDDDWAICSLRFDGSIFGVEYKTVIPDTTNDLETLTLVWAQPVGAGTHTIDVRCRRSGSVVVDDAGLTVSAHL